MAGYVAEIKVLFDIKGSGGEGTTDTPTTGSGGIGASKAGGGKDALGKIREDFKELSSHVIAVSTALKDLQRILSGAVGTTAGAGSRPSDEGGDAAAAAKKAATAAETNVKVASDWAASLEDTKKKLAEAKEETEGYAAGLVEATKVGKGATEAERHRARALSEVVKASGETRKGGKLALVATYENLLKGIANTSELEQAAAKAGDLLKGELIKIPKEASAGAKKGAEELQINVRHHIRNALEQVKMGQAGPKTFSRLQQNINQLWKNYQDQFKDPKIKFNPAAAVQQVVARQFTQTNTQIERDFQLLGQALEKGADGMKIGPMVEKIKEAISEMARIAGSDYSRLFFVGRGKEAHPGAARQASEVKREIGVPSERIGLNELQISAKAVMVDAAKTNRSVFGAVRRMLKELVAGGKGLEKFDDNLRNLKLALRDVDAAAFDTYEEFEKFSEIRGLFKRIKREPTGALKAPAGVAGAKESQLFASEALIRARQRLMRPERGIGQKEVVSFETTDASGGVKKITTELYKLGKGLDRIKTKSRDVSDNMFDRTSVRSALQRVATWGAAAGIIYGSVNALRRAISTITDTESKIIGLAKVMDESTKSMSDFSKRAKQGAIDIAQGFGQPLSEVLDTMILFGQQGRTLAESIELAGAAALAANVTVLDQTTAANALTAATQQFGLATSDAISIVDKFNEVSNNAAVTEQVLAEGLKKAGLAARNSGVSFDELNGIIAAIAEQTRQSGQQIGTALRFIFSRLTTPEAESGLAQVGVAAKDAQGNFRGFMPIVNDLAKAFDTLSQSQKTQVAIAVSGTRRFNTFLALLNNFSEFQDSTANSTNAAGSAMREQEKVMTTASFKIQQLKNSLSGLAVSLGATLLDPLKVLINGLKVMVDILTKLPSVVVTAVAGLGLGSIAFLKFGEQLVNMSGLGTAFVGLGASLRDNLTKGVHAANLPQVLGAEFEAVKTLRPDIYAGRQVGDLASIGLAGGVFAKGTKPLGEFNKALEGAGRRLIDVNGKVVKNADSFSKFGSIVRGHGTKAIKGFGNQALVANVAITSMNSGLGRFGAWLGVLSGKIIRFARAGFVFNILDRALTGLLGTMGMAVATAARFVGGFALLGGAIWGVLKLKSAITSTGESMAKEYDQEIARRQEAVQLIEKQIGATRKLGAVRDKVVRLIGEERGTTTVGQRAVRDERIRRGGYKSPLLEQQRLRKAEQDSANKIGAANPQLIKSIDALGNVTLKSASAFDEMAISASNAQASLLALTQLKAIDALASELKPAAGIKKLFGDIIRWSSVLSWTYEKLGGSAKKAGRTQIENLEVVRREFRKMLDDSRTLAAGALSVDVSLIDKGFSRDLADKGKEFRAYAAQVELTVKAIRDQISKLPTDMGDLALSAMVREGSNTEAALKQYAQSMSVTANREISLRQVVNQILLQGRRPVREAGAGGLIGLSAEETIGHFNERGVIAQVVDLQKNITDQLAEGDLVLFPNVRGMSDQGIVEATESGRLVVRSIGEELQQQVQPLEDVAERVAYQMGKAFKLKPRVVADQINSNLLEVGRIVEGAGRGGLLKKDLELGAKFKFDLSAQQRTSFSDEELFSGIILAEQRLKKFLDGMGASADEMRKRGEKALSPDLVNQFQAFADGVDRLKVIARVKTEIEEAAKAFEKAAYNIKQSGIKEAIKAEFSGFFGARQGLVGRQFESSKKELELSPQQLVDKIIGPEFALFANKLVVTERAFGDMIVGLRTAEMNAKIFLHDFGSSREGGGILDPQRVSAMAEAAARRVAGGISKGAALQVGIAKSQLSETQRQTNILTQLLATQTNNPLQLGSALRQAAEVAYRGSETDRDTFRAAVDRLGSGSFKGMSKTDLAHILRAAPGARGAQAAFGSLAAGQAGADISSELFKSLQEDSTSFSGVIEDAIRVAAARAGLDVTERQGGLESAIQSALAPEIATSALRGGGGQGIGEDAVFRVMRAWVVNLKEVQVATPKWSDKIGEAVGVLEEELKEGGGRMFDTVLAALRSSIDIGSYKSKKVVDAGSRDLFRETIADRKRAEVIEANIRANHVLLQSLKDVTGAFDTVSAAVTGIKSELIIGLRKLFDDISVGASLREFTTPTIGALAGVEVPSIDLGKQFFDELTAKESTALGSPGLSRGLSDANTAFTGMISSLEVVKRKELELARLREGYLSRGNLKGVRNVDEALSQLGSVSEHVRGQIGNAQDTLRRFGESFSDIEIVNQLRLDVEKLFRSFHHQQKSVYDRTSIDTALGKGPFAAVRPTFEQFEQGQGGFKTKFERAIAGIDYRLKQSEITPEGARQEKKKAEFEKDEEIIAFAQQRENKAFESQIGTAEQIRDRLLTYVEKGGPGAGVAEGLFRQLTSELERAGDILPTQGLARERLRDPRTGGAVDVPSSRVMQFRGVTGLKGVVEQVGKLAQQVQKEQAQQQADLITKPLLTVLDQIPGKLDEIVLALDKPEGEQKQLDALTTYLTAVPDLLKVMEALDSGKPVDRQVLLDANRGLSVLIGLSDDMRQFVLEQGKFVTTGGEEMSAQRGLRQMWRRTETGDPNELIKRVNTALGPNLKQLAELEIPAQEFSALKEESLGLVDAFSSLFESVSVLASALGKFVAPFTAAPEGKAQGGFISGPGGPTDDRVPIMASPGEFVINAAAANKIGSTTLNSLNSLGLGGRTARRQGFNFNEGGPVDVEEILANPSKRNFAVWALEAARQGDLKGGERLYRANVQRYFSKESPPEREKRVQKWLKRRREELSEKDVAKVNKTDLQQQSLRGKASIVSDIKHKASGLEEQASNVKSAFSRLAQDAEENIEPYSRTAQELWDKLSSFTDNLKNDPHALVENPEWGDAVLRETEGGLDRMGTFLSGSAFTPKVWISSSTPGKGYGRAGRPSEETAPFRLFQGLRAASLRGNNSGIIPGEESRYSEEDSISPDAAARDPRLFLYENKFAGVERLVTGRTGELLLGRYQYLKDKVGQGRAAGSFGLKGTIAGAGIIKENRREYFGDNMAINILGGAVSGAASGTAKLTGGVGGLAVGGAKLVGSAAQQLYDFPAAYGGSEEAQIRVGRRAGAVVEGVKKAPGFALGIAKAVGSEVKGFGVGAFEVGAGIRSGDVELAFRGAYKAGEAAPGTALSFSGAPGVSRGMARVVEATLPAKVAGKLYTTVGQNLERVARLSDKASPIQYAKAWGRRRAGKPPAPAAGLERAGQAVRNRGEKILAAIQSPALDVRAAKSASTVSGKAPAAYASEMKALEQTVRSTAKSKKVKDLAEATANKTKADKITKDAVKEVKDAEKVAAAVEELVPQKGWPQGAAVAEEAAAVTVGAGKRSLKRRAGAYLAKGSFFSEALSRLGLPVPWALAAGFTAPAALKWLSKGAKQLKGVGGKGPVARGLGGRAWAGLGGAYESLGRGIKGIPSAAAGKLRDKFGGLSLPGAGTRVGYGAGAGAIAGGVPGAVLGGTAGLLPEIAGAGFRGAKALFGAGKDRFSEFFGRFRRGGKGGPSGGLSGGGLGGRGSVGELDPLYRGTPLTDKALLEAGPVGAIDDFVSPLGRVSKEERALRDLVGGTSEMFRPSENLIQRSLRDRGLREKVTAELTRLQKVKRELDSPFTEKQIAVGRRNELSGTPTYMAPESIETVGFTKEFVSTVAEEQFLKNISQREALRQYGVADVFADVLVSGPNKPGVAGAVKTGVPVPVVAGESTINVKTGGKMVSVQPPAEKISGTIPGAPAPRLYGSESALSRRVDADIGTQDVLRAKYPLTGESSTPQEITRLLARGEITPAAREIQGHLALRQGARINRGISRTEYFPRSTGEKLSMGWESQVGSGGVLRLTEDMPGSLSRTAANMLDNPDTLRHFAQQSRKGLPAPPELTAVMEELGGLWHEVTHTTGPVGPRGYVRSGMVPEEVSTEVTRRLSMRQALDVPEELLGTASYEKQIVGVRNSIKDTFGVADDAQAQRILENASVSWRRNKRKRLTSTEEETTRSFARYLETAADDEGLLSAAIRERGLRRHVRNKLMKDMEDVWAEGAIGGAFAAGGKITGPGGPTSDMVPILASNGEFVMNAEAVNNIGLPILKLLNSGGSLGNLPKFAAGGSVGGDSSGGIQVSVNTEEISNAIQQAITDALNSSSISVDAGTAADVIGTAITAAFIDIRLPDVRLETTTISLDTDTVTLDTSTLDRMGLGGGVGAATTEEIRKMQGSIEAAQESAFDAVDKVDKVSAVLGLELPDSVRILEGKTAALESVMEDLKLAQAEFPGGVEVLGEKTTALEITLAEIKLTQDILPIEMEARTNFLISESANEDSMVNDINAKLDRVASRTQEELKELQVKVNDAMRLAQSGFNK